MRSNECSKVRICFVCHMNLTSIEEFHNSDICETYRTTLMPFFIRIPYYFATTNQKLCMFEYWKMTDACIWFMCACIRLACLLSIQFTHVIVTRRMYDILGVVLAKRTYFIRFKCVSGVCDSQPC